MGKKVLVLAPHTDDGELGCGGTIARLIEEGANVWYAAFSICEESVPVHLPKDILEREVAAATAHLGIPRERLIVKKYPVRKFGEYRQAILEDIVVLRNTIRPDLVFMPSSKALHQDHHAIYQEGIRAFKHCTCFGYDLPWDAIEFSTTSFFKLDERHVALKWGAVERYASQDFRTYVDREFVFSLARVRGAQIACSYAEAFEALRAIY